MQPLRDAIKSKYGVSDEVSNQVIAALAEVEKNRQVAAGEQAPKVQGFRARQPGDGRNTQVSVPDITTIANRSANGGLSTRGSGSGSVNTSGILSIIMMIVNLVLSLFSARSRTQTQTGSSGTSGTVINILNDLLGGATTPSQAPDLGSVIGSILQSSGSTQSNQNIDINDILTGMLGSQAASSPTLTRPRSR